MKYHKKEAARQKEREKNNPMRECVLKYDHFENIHRLGKDAKVTIEGAPNVRQVGILLFKSLTSHDEYNFCFTMTSMNTYH